MALPADFSKIFGSTATGGLTPIGDVNYAKGWEFVGSNPPTKNDFSYLQNLSDLKSQWLYSNKLQRTDPFGDIKSDGASAISAALSNLGLKSASQRDVGTGTNQIPDMNSFTSGPGWMKFPSGIIIQYGNKISSDSGSVAVSFPIPFPTQCFGVTGAGTDVNFANIAGCQVIDNAVFYLSAWVVNAGPAFYRTATNISWIAVGI